MFPPSYLTEKICLKRFEPLKSGLEATASALLNERPLSGIGSSDRDDRIEGALLPSGFTLDERPVVSEAAILDQTCEGLALGRLPPEARGTFLPVGAAMGESGYATPAVRGAA
jgi:hypothetical protein